MHKLATPFSMNLLKSSIEWPTIWDRFLHNAQLQFYGVRPISLYIYLSLSLSISLTTVTRSHWFGYVEEANKKATKQIAVQRVLPPLIVKTHQKRRCFFKKKNDIRTKIGFIVTWSPYEIANEQTKQREKQRLRKKRKQKRKKRLKKNDIVFRFFIHIFSQWYIFKVQFYGCEINQTFYL